jgi:hypothetical protein
LQRKREKGKENKVGGGRRFSFRFLLEKYKGKILKPRQGSKNERKNYVC